MHVSVVSPEREVWRGEADMVVARSPEGEFAILRGHIPFLAALVPSKVAVVEGGNREEFFIEGGFLEASGTRDDYHVIVLADSASVLDELDAEAARRRLDEARKSADEEADERAEAELRVAMAQVEIAESRGQ